MRPIWFHENAQKQRETRLRSHESLLCLCLLASTNFGDDPKNRSLRSIFRHISARSNNWMLSGYGSGGVPHSIVWGQGLALGMSPRMIHLPQSAHLCFHTMKPDRARLETPAHSTRWPPFQRFCMYSRQTAGQATSLFNRCYAAKRTRTWEMSCCGNFGGLVTLWAPLRCATRRLMWAALYFPPGRSWKT